MSDVEEEEEAGDGWGNDDDDLSFDDAEKEEEEKDDAAKTTHPPLTSTSVSPRIKDGWDDADLDEDDLLEEAETQETIASHWITPMIIRTASVSLEEQQLLDYLVSLPDAMAPINRLLSQQYNTPEKALELQQYYAARPQLLQYTLEKELPRLAYTLVLDGGASDEDTLATTTTIQDPAAMAPILTQHDATWLGARCANQSILVDVLQALSESGALSLGATALATHCHCTLHIYSLKLSVDAHLQISWPLPSERWILGHWAVSVDFFCPQPSVSSSPPPRVQFRVLHWTPMPPDNEERPRKIQQYAALWREQCAFDDDLDRQVQVHSDTTAGARDAFWQEHWPGVQSAWQDLDAATGLVSKLSQLPALLPSPVDEEEDVVAPRPTSIWGGLVRSIAQSLPTEEVPPPSPEPTAVRLYRPSPPKLALDRPPDPAIAAPAATSMAAVRGSPPIGPTMAAAATARPLPPVGVEQTTTTKDRPSPPAAATAPFPADEGWDDTDDFWKDELSHHSTTPNQEEILEEEWIYDPVTDILPTRTRWVNPMPGRRDLRYL